MEAVFDAFATWQLWAIVFIGLAAWYGLGWLLAHLTLGMGTVKACNLAATLSTIAAPLVAGTVGYFWRGYYEGALVAALDLLFSLAIIFAFVRGRK